MQGNLVTDYRDELELEKRKTEHSIVMGKLFTFHRFVIITLVDWTRKDGGYNTDTSTQHLREVQSEKWTIQNYAIQSSNLWSQAL
jgi:hypothetical protein